MTIVSENMFKQLSVGELPVGRRFQIQGRKHIFMKVELTSYLRNMVSDDLDGTTVINLDTGMVFCMETDTATL